MENPRECALDVLIKVDKKEELSHIAISNVLEKYQFSEKRDRAFFTRLVEGTLERQITIDYVADQFSKTKIRKCKPLIRALLRMGIYQILYMDQVPDSAACNEAVKLAKKRGFSRLSGFVNGVLRNISRKKETISYPKKDKNLVTYLSVTYSIPEWIIKFFMKTYDDETVEKIIESYLEDKKTTLCCLMSKGGKDVIRKELEEENVTVEDGELIENAVKISDYDFLYRLRAFREGKCYVQDESSMLCAKLAGAKEGQFVMDLCSAPGGKSLYTADQMKGSGQVLSRDLTEYKTDLIWQNIDRSGLGNICAVCKDASVFDEYDKETADLVIADLPCSGLGVLGKKPDLKYRVQPEDLEELADLQRKILTCAQAIVKDGGTLMYSTCTVNPGENMDNVHWFLKEYPQFELDDITENLCKELRSDVIEKGCIQFFPGVHDCDGFFIARLKKKA